MGTLEFVNSTRDKDGLIDCASLNITHTYTKSIFIYLISFESYDRPREWSSEMENQGLFRAGNLTRLAQSTLELELRNEFSNNKIPYYCYNTTLSLRTKPSKYANNARQKLHRGISK